MTASRIKEGETGLIKTGIRGEDVHVENEGRGMGVFRLMRTRGRETSHQGRRWLE